MSALRTRPSVDNAVRRRDLASPDLWERSLHRSRERRRVAEIHRRTAPKRKGVSLAVSAALLASPVFPRFASAHAGPGVATSTGETGGPAVPDAPRLLERGDTGSAVKELQRALGVTADGIFGPITEAAVKRFQAHEGLPGTGRVDPTTWMKLFSGNVTVLEAGTPEAQAIQTAAGDEPTPAVTASSSPAMDASAVASATPATFRPADQGESEARGSEGERSEVRATGGERREPARPRRASSDDGDRAPSQRPESPDAGNDRGSRSQPASDEREDSRPASDPAPAPSGDGGGGSCDGDFARPVNGTVTSVFGEDRGGRSHEGMDIAAPAGTAIKAATCGRVSEAAYQGGYGNIICIRASASLTTCYAHLSRFGASVGQYVKIGEVIGYVGCTGSCTGPHVHFEVRVDGRKVDPASYLNGSKRALSARSRSTMAVRLTDSTRKTPEARAAKRARVSRQHDEAAKDPAQQPQNSTAASGGDAPTDAAAPTTASTEPPAAGAPAAADPSTQAPEQEAAPSTGTGEDTGAVEETAAAVEEETATEAPGAVEETAGATVEETTSTVEETTGTDAPGTDTGSAEETTSNVEEETSSTIEETTGTDAPGSDTGSAEETTSNVEEETSSTIEETTGAVEETTGAREDDASSAVEDTTGGVDDATGSSAEESDAPGEEEGDTSSDDEAGDEASEEDSSGAEEPAGATAGG